MSDAQFWAERVRRHGHTGWSDPAVYAYDQRLRLAAVRTLLPAAVEPEAAALDYGCGSGDFCALLAGRFARVVGYDAAPAVLEVARRRHGAAGLAWTADLDAALQGRYAFILSVTVLQHVLDDAELAALLRRLAVALAPGGRFVVLETFATAAATATGYLKRRPRAEFVRLCAAAGLQARRDIGFYHPGECPTPAYLRYRRRPAVRVLGRLAGWRVPGAAAALHGIAERAADGDRYALDRPASPTRLMLFEHRSP